MPYTLWSKGRLVGHTEFEFIANTDEHKMGWFHPTETGQSIMEIMTEPSRVFSGFRHGADTDSICTDLEAAGDRIEALELELRSPEGIRLDVEDISINDTEHLMQLAAEAEAEFEHEELSEELQASIAHDMELLEAIDGDDIEDMPWEDPAFPRYQILVFF